MNKGILLAGVATAILGTTGCSNKSPELNSNLLDSYISKITKPVEQTKRFVFNIQDVDKKQDKISSKPQNNFSLYGAGTKVGENSHSGVGFKYEGKNYILSAEKIDDLKKVAAIIVHKIGKNLYVKGGAGYLEKDFEYKGVNFTAEQLKIGMALLYTDNKKYNIEIGQIEVILKGLDNADTVSHITFIDGTYKSGDFDVEGTVENANVYGENYTNFEVGAGYYPTEDSRVGVKYNSSAQREADYAVRAGLTYTFGKGEEKGKLSPYLNASYNASDHVTTTVNYENNITNKPFHLRDKFGKIIDSSDITAQRYNPTEFNKRLDKNIEDRNKAPIAKNDKATVEEGKTYNIDVLKNDSDPEGKSLHITQITDINGKFKIVNNKIQFEADNSGTFSCNYIISDGGKFATAKVTVTVTEKPKPNNTEPEANADSVSTAHNTTITVDVLSNDTDANNDTLTITEITDKVGGAFTITSGKIKFIPTTGFSGDASCNYKISDGKGGFDTANLKVTVDSAPTTNEAPVAVDDNFSTSHNTAVSLNLISNDTDAEGDIITIESNTSPSKGTLTVSPNGIYTYTPNNGETGTDTFTYTINGGSIGTVTINIASAPNQAPTAPDLEKDANNNNSASIDLSSYISDPEGDNLSIKIISATNIGTSDLIGIKTNITGKTVNISVTGGSGNAKVVYKVLDGYGGEAIAEIAFTNLLGE